MLPAFSDGEGCGCELDETYFPVNSKGNHTNSAFKIPRPAQKRGGEVHFRGLSREQVCVMAAGSAEVCGRPTRQTETCVYHRRSADRWGLPVAV